MIISDFILSVDKKIAPSFSSLYLEALWYAGIGDWDKSHDLIQDEPGNDAAHLHAYLHRVEGDQGNADYWYRRAGELTPTCGLKEEWKTLVEKFIS
jgi:endonuclease I